MIRTLKILLVVGLLLSAGLVLLVAGCGKDEAQVLEGTTWIMTAYAVDSSMNEALPSPRVDATFAEGQVSGNAGINQYSGSYTVDGNGLAVSQVAATRMAGDPAVMDQEAVYLAALESAASYEIDGRTLTLMDSSEKAVLEFIAADE